MICSLQNKSSISLLVDFTDGTCKMLEPGQMLLYDDSIKIPTEATWVLVERGLIENVNHEDAFHVYKLLYDVIPPIHNWVFEGF